MFLSCHDAHVSTKSSCQKRISYAALGVPRNCCNHDFRLLLDVHASFLGYVTFSSQRYPRPPYKPEHGVDDKDGEALSHLMGEPVGVCRR
jgi:hypothetical protein